MSWSTYIGPTAAKDVKASLDVAPLPEGVSDQVQEQVAVAKKAALAIVKSGAVGGTDKHFNVSLSGHANPDHEPAEGWANDCITVSVAQITVATEPAAAEDTGEGAVEEQAAE